jgi:hypothetical protein
MGQQQLLLLVLGIVIVGLAVVVGIQAFGENQKKANADAMVNDGVRIVSDAQAWALKPQAFGGPADGEDLSDVTFLDLGYDGTATAYENLNGEYTLAASGAGILITGESINGEGNTVYVQACGTDPDQVNTVVNGTAPTACS